MLQYFTWNVDPVLFDFGWLKIRWYGLTFAIGFLLAYKLMKKIYQKENHSESDLETLFFYVFIGTLVGARLGHCFFYEPTYYFGNPLKILAVWEGGLASHGGAAGVIISVYLYCRSKGESFFWLLDRLAIVTPLTAFFIRVGNFFNSEIIGDVSNKPWAVVFKKRPDLGEAPRHPTQLYEACIYITIFFVLLKLSTLSKFKDKQGRLLGVFLILTFSARFFIEFIKVNQEKYDSGMLNTGQLLSIPFVFIGIILCTFSTRKSKGK